MRKSIDLTETSARGFAEASGNPFMAGYKSTEVGDIPEDWEIRPLTAISWFQEGPGLRDWQFTSTGMKVINVTNLENGVLNLERTDRHIRLSEFNKMYKHFAVDVADLVMASSGNSYSKTAVVRQQDLPLVMNTSVIRFKPLKGCDYRFLSAFLNSPLFKSQIDLMITGGAQPNFGPFHLKRVNVPVPPIPEQCAIGEALSDVDESLAALKALIEKRRVIKQSAMQQLLTGRTRLPGFTAEWETKRLYEIGRFLKGCGVNRESALSGSLACIRYGEIYTTHNDYIRKFHSWISSQVAATATRLEFGDLLFAGSGETREEIGKCVAFVTNIEAYAGGDIVILRPREMNSLFLGYVLNTPEIAEQKARLGQGDAVVHISAKALGQVRVRLPKLQEQTAIATVLLDMDAEILALEARRDKTLTIKKGMMQQLLTGRTRLVKPQPAEAEA
jgi:type I restriction enzyme, S subunit